MLPGHGDRRAGMLPGTPHPPAGAWSRIRAGFLEEILGEVFLCFKNNNLYSVTHESSGMLSTPMLATVTVVQSSPTASVFSTSQVVMGRSTLTGVILGQDSITFNRKKGFGPDCFYAGEIVSMARSDGRRTIGQILSVSATAMTVDMGGGARKEVTAADIPERVSKLLGLYYLAA